MRCGRTWWRTAAAPDAPGSVHLAGYPEADEARIAAGLLAPMADVRAICELGHRARADAKLRVRQPLASAIVGVRRMRRGLKRSPPAACSRRSRASSMSSS